MPPFELVLFDNDGVLVDSEALSSRVLSGLLTSYDLPTTPEESMRTYLGRSMASVRAVAERRLGAALPDDFEEVYYQELFARFESDLAPVPGVRAVLEALDTPTCVVSSGSPERIELTLRLTGLRHFFGDRVYSAEQVERGKPAPDLFLHAARELGASPARCAVIEDSPLGIEAADAAGMTAFGYAAMTPPEWLQRAHGGTFRDMIELPGLLKCQAAEGAARRA